MKIKSGVISVFLTLCITTLLFSQEEKEITGKVEDDEGLPLPSVNISVEGTDSGTETDFDGEYSIEAKPGQTLIFSYVGMEEQHKEVGDSETIDVTMEEGEESQLDEVVVTALGIEKEEKNVTSSQQKVSSDEITKTKQPNFVNSLDGKVSGLNIKKSAAGAGGSSKIKLRGNKSISSVSEPLFVIDGIPMLNNSPGGGENSPFDNRDNGDGLSQINPEDIKDISVLKGANAAALYGSQGANGVILIETKDGEPGKLHGNVSSGAQFQGAIKKPHLQFRYGQKGDSGDESWSTERKDYNDKFVDDFFDTGVELTNSLSLSGGSENSTSYLSYANTSSDGIIPENNYLKNNVTFKQTNKFLDDKLKVTGRVMLADEKIKNRPSTGYYSNPLTGLYMFPRNKDFDQYRDYETFDEDRNLMLQNWFVESDQQQNPFWIINNNRTDSRKKRLIANIGISYDLSDKINFQVRGNYDQSRTEIEQKYKAGTTGTIAPENGRYRFEDLTSSKVYADALFNYTDDFGDFDLDLTLGGSFQRTKLGDGIDADSDTQGLKYANIFTLQNFDDSALISQTMDSQLEKQGIFGTVRIGYKDMINLDFAGRNDWSSSLAFTENTSYFYPSVGTSILLNEMFDLPETVSFAKLRASYSKVSNEVPSFFSNPINEIDENGIDFNTERPFEELKPEDQYNLEIGTDLRFFENRLGLDFTYYKIDNKNQFIPLDAPSGSGYSKYYVNAGHIRNYGFEVGIDAKPVDNNEFQWSSKVNFSSNKNKILKLHPELEGRYQLSKSEGYASYVTQGGHFSDIYTYKFERDDQGRIKVNDEGEPERSSEEKLIGDSEPDFNLGWNNNFTYKNWNFSFLIDGAFGGKVVSGTEAALDSYGVTEETAQARDRGEVKINGVDPDGEAVSSVDPETYYKAVGGRDGILENYVYDATNVRLREVSLTYNFEFNDSSFFDNANVSFVANNLFFMYIDSPFDPDLSFSNGNHFQGFDLFTPPSTRSYGINLNLKF